MSDRPPSRHDAPRRKDPAALVDAGLEKLKGGQAFPPDFDPRAIARRARRRRRALQSMAVVATCIAVWLLADPGLLSDYRSPVGRVTRVVLPDGSLVHLDSGSAMSWQETDGERRVRLHRGMASFETAPDPDRPFTVETDAIATRALGTVFAVSAYGDGWAALVRSGKVRVSRRESAHAVIVAPGRAVWVEPGSPGLKAEAVDGARALAWQSGRLDFQDEPLRRVIETLDRYRPGRILLLNETAGARRFDGVLSLEDVDQSLAIVAASSRLEVSVSLPYLVVLR